MSAIRSDFYAFSWPLQANSWSASLASCGLEATKATEGIKLLFFLLLHSNWNVSRGFLRIFYVLCN